jgi:hypothetical protein
MYIRRYHHGGRLLEIPAGTGAADMEISVTF